MLVLAGLTLPPAASAATVICMAFLDGGYGRVVLLGLAAGAVVALIVGGTVWLLATSGGWNQREGGELRARLRSLDEGLTRTDPALIQANGRRRDGRDEEGWHRAHRHAQALSATLRLRQLHWVAGMGYINAWSELHRGEEALIRWAPTPAAVQAAVDADLRLRGSQVPNGLELARKLRLAVRDLDRPAVKYLTQPATPDAGSTGSAASARAVLEEVCCAINRYRDGIWEGLVDARNILLAKVAVGWVLTYAGVVVVTLWAQNGPSFLSGAVFFLVGAVVGGANDIVQQQLAHSEVEDYGVAAARFAATILISGMAALIGVALASVAGFSVSGVQIARAHSWTNVFDVAGNLPALLVAAAFGYAPTRLFDLLKKDATTAAQQLKSTEASQGGPGS